MLAEVPLVRYGGCLLCQVIWKYAESCNTCSIYARGAGSETDGSADENEFVSDPLYSLC